MGIRLAHYVGNHPPLRSAISEECRRRGGVLAEYEDSEKLLRGRDEELRGAGHASSAAQWHEQLQARLAPAVLDLELPPVRLSEVLRTIRQRALALPLLVVGEPSLLGVTLCQMQGAEAHFDRTPSSSRAILCALRRIWRRQETWRMQVQAAVKETERRSAAFLRKRRRTAVRPFPQLTAHGIPAL